jgi:deoxyhypusine monooxygenase
MPASRTDATDFHVDFPLLEQMEQEFQHKNEQFFVDVLSKPQSLLIRIHAVCILAEIGTEQCIAALAKVLRDDPSPLARHEAAFTIGQLGLKPAVPVLLDDPSPIVRHESAVALGSIGDQTAREPLKTALDDSDEDVRVSALLALADLDFLQSLAQKHHFKL